MRTQPESAPDPAYRHPANSRPLGHLAGAPMGRALGRGLKRANHHLFHLLIADLAGRTQSRFVQQTVQTMGNEALPPFADRRRPYSQLVRHCFIVETGGAAQHDHQKPVQGVQRPQGGSDSAGFSDAVQKVHDRWGVLVLEAPGERNGIIDEEAHGRPSLTRSLILRPRSMTPLLASRRPAAARFAFSRSNPDSADTSLATAFPWRVITISAPCSTWSRRALNLFFASNDTISRMSISSYLFIYLTFN